MSTQIESTRRQQEQDNQYFDDQTSVLKVRTASARRAEQEMSKKEEALSRRHDELHSREAYLLEWDKYIRFEEASRGSRQQKVDDAMSKVLRREQSAEARRERITADEASLSKRRGSIRADMGELDSLDKGLVEDRAKLV